MARCLTPAIYDALSDKKTPSGFTIDKCIQTGVDNPGHPFIMTVGKPKYSSKIKSQLLNDSVFGKISEQQIA